MMATFSKDERHRLVRYIGVGAGVGMTVGAAIDAAGAGIPLGAGVGIAVGIALARFMRSLGGTRNAKSGAAPDTGRR